MPQPKSYFYLLQIQRLILGLGLIYGIFADTSKNGGQNRKITFILSLKQRSCNLLIESDYLIQPYDNRSMQ